MATIETNDAKRAEMARLVGVLIGSGWNTAQLGALLGVSSGTVRAWKAGVTMGTNAQRAEMHKLLAFPHEQRILIRDRIAMLKMSIASIIGETRAKDRYLSWIATLQGMLR